jgi:hypothetical protein
MRSASVQVERIRPRAGPGRGAMMPCPKSRPAWSANAATSATPVKPRAGRSGHQWSPLAGRVSVIHPSGLIQIVHSGASIA